MNHTPQDRQIPAPLCLAAHAERAPGPALPAVVRRTRPRVGVPGVPPRLTSAELVAAGVRAELLESLALRRALSGRVAKSGDHYFDYGFPLPSFLIQICDELTEAGLLTLAEDSWGMLRLGISEAGRSRYAQLSASGLDPTAGTDAEGNDRLVNRLVSEDRWLAAGGACGPRRCAPGGQPVTSHPRADVDGIPIPLFAQVELVAEDTEPSMLPSRLHQQGQVVGRGLECLYVCFPGGQVISVRPELVRVLEDVSGGD